MNILVVGNGGRENALAWKLLQSPNVEAVICTPGNGGTSILEGCKNVAIAVDDFEGIAKTALSHQVSLVIVGPEIPLAKGITDYLQNYNIPVFGPNQIGATIESSKAWAKSLMIEAGIPTAKAMTFTNIEDAIAYVNQEGAPIVVKADELAAGKGVIVADSVDGAHNAIKTLFEQGFSSLVIEEFIEGEEVSVLALTDGITIIPLLPSQDHKRIGEKDTGNNTGGMGAYAPTPLATPELMQRIETEVLQPTLATLQKRGIDYRGVLYAGLMITPEGEPKVLEFNCRFGDPETQAILPLLETPLDELLLACVEQKLASLPSIKWFNGSAVCVVISAGGYPSNYVKGMPITGIDSAQKQGAIVFQAGTTLRDNQILTDGGRVLGVTASDKDLATAITKAYQAIDSIHFPDMYFRRDIGHRALSQSAVRGNSWVKG